MVRVLAPGAYEVAGRPGRAARQAAVPPAHEGRAGPLRQGCLRHPVRVSLRLAGIRRHSQPDELRPVAAPGVFGEEARVFGCRDERALHSIRGRNVGGRRPHDARRNGGRVPRGRSGRREAGGVALASRDRSTESRGVPLGEQGWDARAGAPHLRRFAEALQHVLRRRRLDRSPLSPPGRGRHAVRHHHRRSVHPGRHLDGARPGHVKTDSPRRRPAGRIPRGAPEELNAECGVRNAEWKGGRRFRIPNSAFRTGQAGWWRWTSAPRPSPIRCTGTSTPWVSACRSSGAVAGPICTRGSSSTMARSRAWLDWAAEENFKRHEGQPFDPVFYRSGEELVPGVYKVDDDVFMERTTWNVQRGGEEVEAAWHGRRYRVSFPHQSGRPLFLTLEGLVDPPPGDAILVVTPAPRLLDLFRRRPAAVQGVVEVTPLDG